MIIIMRFGENNVLVPKYIDIYKFFMGSQGGGGYMCGVWEYVWPLDGGYVKKAMIRIYIVADHKQV